MLFDREEGRLRVTEAGKLLYPFAKAIVNDFNHSKEVIQQSTGKYNANLIVGASLTIGEYLLPSLLGRFKKQQPEIKVTLTIKKYAPGFWRIFQTMSLIWPWWKDLWKTPILL
ncbi:hypothetical protein RCO48_10285 [Peribacillus frigoritolerans]|nr:hypothetical protein [Peribacillus frigoritolerans]